MSEPVLEERNDLRHQRPDGAVAARAGEELETVARTECRVEALGLVVRRLRPAEREHVFGGADHGIRTRRGQLDEVRKVQPICDGIRDDLLAILRALSLQ